jgi:hypothetical protein
MASFRSWEPGLESGIRSFKNNTRRATSLRSKIRRSSSKTARTTSVIRDALQKARSAW